MYNFKTPISLIVIGLAALYSANAAATYSTQSWSTDYSSDRGDGTSYSYDKSSTYDKKVTVSAWSNTEYAGKLGKKQVKYSDTGKHYGVDNDKSEDDEWTWDGSKYQYDRDYVDNDTYMDSVLFDYGDDCVVLDSVIIDKDGYNSDSDIKIMAFTGDKHSLKDKNDNKYASFDDYLKDKSYDELMNDGNWKSYDASDVKRDRNSHDSDGDGSDDSYKKNFAVKKDWNGNIISEDYTASSYWLVMADSKADSEKDYFKIKHMGGYDYDSSKGGCQKVEIICDNTSVPPEGQVPVPATGALFALGLTLLGYTRRRRA